MCLSSVDDKTFVVEMMSDDLDSMFFAGLILPVLSFSPPIIGPPPFPLHGCQSCSYLAATRGTAAVN